MTKPIPVFDIINSPVNKEKQSISAETFMNAINGKSNATQEPAAQQYAGGMAVHIEIERTARNGDSLVIKADISNQEDLAAFHETYRGYLPRKKWLGIL